MKRPIAVSVLSVGVSLALFAAACGGSDESDQPAASWSFESEVPETVEEVLAVVSPYQREILKDGYVSPGEYETAVLDMVRCAEERGVTVGTQPEWRDGGKTIY